MRKYYAYPTAACAALAAACIVLAALGEGLSAAICAAVCLVCALLVLPAVNAYRRRLDEAAGRERDALSAELDAARREAEENLALAEKNTALGRQELLRFHSRVSHSMRIPISVIQGYAELLRDGIVSDEEVRLEYLAKICDRVKYMDDLLAQLLLEAREDADISSLVLQRVDMVALSRHIAEDVRPAALKLGIAVRVAAAVEPLEIMADVTQLTKVFYNILENSLKYMGREGCVNITVSPGADNDCLVVFKDDGVGLRQEETEHIFELSYQGSNRTTGNGLGLHMAKLVIQAHGGEIFARSGEGKGMGIYIRLPQGQKP